MSAIFHWARLYLRPAVLAVTLAITFVCSAAIAEESAKAGASAASDAFVNDPIHQAGLKASANHKIVFVLGEGFDEELSLVVLKDDLAKLGLLEHKHYDVLKGAKLPKESGVIYVGGEVLKLKATNEPFKFNHDQTDTAVVALENLIKSGTIIVSK